ncbi:hypothetical protein AWC38_SpisGene5195 [Stylophora pistillata]|uniref:Uncharacterized protein n=1 Tax=Stylophora pistillata TaxID=50429 RepID=A0A2B4SN18_STYPI|nr:hypothetical protein AWC38_SpisGene5195 [Stylophora pistillata]
MVVSFTRTIDVDCGGLPKGMLFPEAVKLLLELFDRESDHQVAAVQAYPDRVARVTFVKNGELAKLFFEELGVVKLGDVESRVQEGHFARNCKVAVGTLAEVVELPAVTVAESDTQQDEITGGDEEVCSLSGSEASEDRFASLPNVNGDDVPDPAIIPADEDFASPAVEPPVSFADQKMSTDESTVKRPTRRDILAPSAPSVAFKNSAKKVHALPMGAIVAAMEASSTKIPPESAIRNGDASVLRQLLELFHCSKEQIEIMWEICVDYRKPPSQRKTYGMWTLDPRFSGLMDKEIEAALAFFNQTFPS